MEHGGKGLRNGIPVRGGVLDGLRKVQRQCRDGLAAQEAEQSRRRGHRRQFPDDTFEVEANAPIAQHREQMKQDATSAESGEDRHVRCLGGLAVCCRNLIWPEFRRFTRDLGIPRSGADARCVGALRWRSVAEPRGVFPQSGDVSSRTFPGHFSETTAHARFRYE
jgi:hypothetical protein